MRTARRESTTRRRPWRSGVHDLTEATAECDLFARSTAGAAKTFAEPFHDGGLARVIATISSTPTRLARALHPRPRPEMRKSTS